MLPPGSLIWCVLLTLCMSACGLEISDYDGKDVICEQSLSECTVRDEVLMSVPDEAVDVQNLTPKFKLCCEDVAACTLCLVIDVELYILPDNNTEYHSGNDEEDYSDPKASATVCYNAARNLPTCKKVEFTVNHTALTQSSLAKMSMVINKPVGVFFSSQVFVYSSNRVTQFVVAPSEAEVCSHELQKHNEECYVPKLISVINLDMNQVELQFTGSNTSSHFVCAQYERDGRCQELNRMAIPLHSVTPCTCFQAWHKDDNKPLRSQSCPFADEEPKGLFEKILWQNVSVTVGPGQMNNYGTMLLWNLSAPCRLEGDVWPCYRTSVLTGNCREIEGFRQQLANSTWNQNSKGHWGKTGVFENIDLQLSPCVMVEVKAKESKLGPFCYNTGRWHWSLLVVTVILLVCLTALLFYLLRNFLKRWVRSWHHRGFVTSSKKGYVLLLSPPDVDNGVSESICRLGSLLCEQGFSVSVDQWSRKQHWTMGPLPWLHSQLLDLNSLGGRVVLVLTRKALELAKEWIHQHQERDRGLPQVWSPYSDVFRATLSLIQGDNLMGRAGERFVLVKFDLAVQTLPEPLQGLPLFQLPSQTQALLSELTVGGKTKGPRRKDIDSVNMAYL